MAADETQVPATPWPGKSWFVELGDNVQKCVDMGVADGTDDTVAELLASIAVEVGKR